jgi:hypothetical protein
MLRILLVSFGLSLASPGAFASIPVDLEERSREGLQHVCRDREPGDSGYVACVAQVGGAESEYTGAECAAAGLPPVCTLDFVKKVRLKGRLLLFRDDHARNFSGTPGVQSGIVLEVKAGRHSASFAELFDLAGIGHWNEFPESFLAAQADPFQFTNAEGSAFNFASDNLADLGAALRELAQQAFPTADLSGSIAVLTSVVREKPKRNVAHDDPADALASAARFRVVIEFVRLRP